SPFDSPTFERDASIRVNEPVGSASISPSNRDVVLASREGLHIIDLDNPYSPPRHILHRTSWEVADVQWSPFAFKDGLVASTSNQKALIWDLYHSERPPLVLHKHSRAITDINLSAHHPDLLATCAVDSFVHTWDLRTSAKPVCSYAQWNAGAAQVKWNRQDKHILASAHDKNLCIWDERKGAVPLCIIQAHRSKIYGVDWNRTRAGGVLTCSLDGSIKFWDYTKSESAPERVIRTPFGVWRARHTPFGWGALAMPQRGNFDLHLYDRRLTQGIARDGEVPPVHSFKGHNDQVKEFLWRTRGDVNDGIDDREFQLVSWGADRMLNLHRVNPSLLKSVGYEKGKEVRRKFTLTRAGAEYKTFHDEPNHAFEMPMMTADHSETPAGHSQLSALFHSAGMSKATLPYAQVGFQGPAKSTRGKSMLNSSNTMQARTREKKNVDKLAWMRGVKIGAPNSVLDRHTSRPDVFSPDHQFLWDSPDSLGDEITYVGSKFKKVKFEEIEIPRRTAVVALNGPWGEEEKPIFMRISFRFPPDYPVAATPHCKLEKTTSAISDKTLAKLDAEISALAEIYKNRKRGSLDAIISYLLGERGLEESISWLSDEAPTDAGLPEQDESSSDEEDDVGGDFNGVRTQDSMELSGTDVLGPINANANVPLPKACGAIWSRDGRLICFFPPKPEPKPMFNLATLSSDDRFSKSQRIFEMFGRLQNESTGPGHHSSIATGQDDDGDSQSWETSSSSSSSSPILGGLTGRIPPPAAWRGGPLRFQRSSQHSSAGYEANPAPIKPKSIVTIPNFEHLLPSKRAFGREYEIYGEGPMVAAHNARVARQYGDDELGDIWDLVGLLLNNQVPLDVMQQDYRREPIVTVARRSIVRINRKDSGIDLGFDEPEAVAHPKLRGRVKWGEHPIAAKQLIPALFEHFEQRADTQMLAMLSCMFHEPAANEGITNAMMKRLGQPPSIAVRGHGGMHTRHNSGSDFVISKNDKRLNTFGSAGSSNGPWGSDNYPSGATTPHSTGITPPTLSRSNTIRSIVSAQHSLSSSPEQVHSVGKRSNTNLSNAFSSFSRPFAGNTSSSPPVTLRAREADLSTSAPSSTVTWGANTVYEGAPQATLSQRSFANRRRTQTMHYENEIPENKPIMPILKNQNQFDEDGYASVPLLDQEKNDLYACYRENYANNELLAWGFPVKRSEVLKYNG
ncbi:WD40 repeat-like protein, partial [Saccharata proteae CBS 121410]